MSASASVNIEMDMCNDEAGGESQKFVLLKSSDEKIFKVPLKIAFMSKTIKTMFNTETDDPIILSLTTIESGILKKVLLYAKEHQNDEVKEKEIETEEDDYESRLTRSIESDWDFDFFKVEPRVVNGILVAANFLEIPSLVNSACKNVVNKIKGKGPDEIRKFFNMENDLTQEDLEQIERENQWIQEK